MWLPVEGTIGLKGGRLKKECRPIVLDKYIFLLGK